MIWIRRPNHSLEVTVLADPASPPHSRGFAGQALVRHLSFNVAHALNAEGITDES
jgi:hypothetical protein